MALLMSPVLKGKTAVGTMTAVQLKAVQAYRRGSKIEFPMSTAANSISAEKGTVIHNSAGSCLSFPRLGDSRRRMTHETANEAQRKHLRVAANINFDDQQLNETPFFR